MTNVIAEIGINANGNIDNAKKLIDLASLAGFNYVKFQKRDIDLCVPEHKKNEIKSTPWGPMTYYDYKDKMEFSYNDYEEINEYCNEKNIKWFASVWDVNSIDFMEYFSSIVKIPSAMITNIELLKKARSKFDTLIMSTGMSTEKEINTAIAACKPDVIMHTNSTYPTPLDEMNLNYIIWLMAQHKDSEIGYSGHEFGIAHTIGTVLMGVTWIERHITLDRTLWGSDQFASVEPVGCFKLIKGIRDAEKAKGKCCARVVFESEKKKLLDLRK